MNTLLNIYNHIWVTGIFPPSWKEATILPIPKPSKDHTSPSNYRPISLTSCLCKTLERMINARLVWFLETNNLLNNIQCGFRQRRSTVDHLTRLDHYIRDAFRRKEHVVSVFFYLEKAYETTWQYGILKDLDSFGMKGRLPTFIKNFLANRSFKVRIGSTYSDSYPQAMGVPQGSVLSVTLFSIKINSIVQTLKSDTESSLYVDDFSISYCSKHMSTIERHLQLCLNRLSHWADSNGFKFSTSKTVCMHFCHMRGLHPEPSLSLNRTSITVVKEFKFLGLYLDSKLTYIPHIKYLTTKCKRSLNILKVLANTDWGADKDTLLIAYRALIRSKLDYACIIYGSTRASYLRSLNTVHNTGLRICLGAYRTSPIESLYAEANEPSLHYRRLQLSIDYMTRMCSSPTNPAYTYVFSNKFEDYYINHPSLIPPFGTRILPHFEASNVPKDSIITAYITKTPPWLLRHPSIIYKLHQYSKTTTNSLIYQTMFSEVRDEYPNHQPIYTDGSKENAKVAAAMFAFPILHSIRLPDFSTIFTAELHAILLALQHIHSSSGQSFFIFTDSLSALQAMSNFKITHPLVLSIFDHITQLAHNRKDIIFCWIPSHMGIRGNEIVDKAAKLALSKDISDTVFVPFTDFKSLSKQYIHYFWQQDWNNASANKLHTIFPLLQQQITMGSRRNQVLIARLRMGHTRLTHSYLFTHENPPQCEHCSLPLTVSHVLLTCSHFHHIRSKYFNVNNLLSLFKHIHLDNIISYIKEIGFYYKF